LQKIIDKYRNNFLRASIDIGTNSCRLFIAEVKEIDNEIRLLRLEKEIDRLSLSQQVSASAESLTPKNLLANTWVSLLFNNKRWINIALEYGMQLLAKRYLNKNR